MEISDVAKGELTVRSALLERGFPQKTATEEGFMVTTLHGDVFRSGESIVEIAHAPREKATLDQISAYRTALETHQVNTYLRCWIVPVGPGNEYRLWARYAAPLWSEDEIAG